MPTPYIPEYITVHLGAPNEPVENITVSFTDYIKNVASSEIYPTWPESSLRANIYAQITFALNRIYTEWYRSKGYDFDITSSTVYDQAFFEGRDYFENLVKIVDEIFNDYVVKQGSIVPYFTQYCDGRNVQCEGLSQWGSVDLANQGLTPYEILQNYYGDDINIVKNAPVRENIPSYPGVPLRVGQFSEQVRTIQRQLNRISDNYTAIPKILNTNGFFSMQTEYAVKKFQEIFNLEVDGIVGKATWYKIKYMYTSIKKLSELYAESLTFDEVSQIYAKVLKKGDNGEQVGLVQYYLAVIAYFDDSLPMLRLDRLFDQNTENAVLAFQKKYGLTVDGEIGRETFFKLTEVYDALRKKLQLQNSSVSEKIFPGRFLGQGMSGEDVELLQKYLQKISAADSTVPKVQPTGTYDGSTVNAVKAIQAKNAITPNGIVGPLTWNVIVSLAD